MICKQKDHSWRILSYLLVLFAAGLAPLYVHAQTPQRLLQSDFTYVGAFKVPGGTIGQDMFDYSGGFVSGNVYNDPVNGKTIFATGYLSNGVSQSVRVAQLKIPSTILNPNSVGVNGLTTATVVQGFSDPSSGIGSQALGSGGNGFGSLVVYGGKLIGTESSGYDAACAQTKSAWVSSLDFSQPGASGPYAFSSPFTPRIIGGGFMTVIPPEWQSALGGKVVSGNGPWSIVSCGSPGPSLFVIDADKLISQPSANTVIPSTPLIYYVENSTQASLGHWNSNSPNQVVNGKTVPSVTVTNPNDGKSYTIAYEDNSMRIKGVLFADGTRSVLFFGTKGLGPYCYGTGGASGGECHDPDQSGRGDHAYPYANFVWAYDVNDLVAAKNGQKNPWDVLPYTGWTMSQGGGGMAWDSSTRLGYLFEPCALTNCVPIVHVFQVGLGNGSTVPPPNPAPTVALSATPTSVLTGFASTLTWSSTNVTSCNASGAWSGSKATSGTQSTGALTSPATYSLTCTGIGGSATQSTTIAITTQPPPDTIVVSPAALSLTGVVGGARPSAINVTVTTGNGNSWTSQDTCSFFNAAPTAGSSGSSHTLTPSSGWDSLAIGSYQCPITYGSPGNNSVVVQVAAIKQSAIPTPAPTPPAVTISANPTSIASGSSSTLSWNSTNATSCTASGSWSGSKATSGTQSTGALTTASSYTLSCTGLGGSASQSTTVAVTSPPSPPPPPQQGSNITVSNVSALQSAIAGLTSNNTILLADGTYNLNGTLYLPQNLSNVTIKGASGNRDTVIIKGPGMTNSTVPFGFWADNVNGVTFQDVTIRDFNQHAIILNGGVNSPVFRNLRIIDIGDQFLKNNPTADGLNGVDNGLVENSLLEYSSAAPDSYTNGLDVHRGKNWIIRGNTFRNFSSAVGLAGPAILMWNGSSDTTVVRNSFINNQRDISLGLDPTKPSDGTTDHARGFIANNFIYKTSSIAPDVPIAIFDSPQTKVYHNTILLNGGYPNSIEYRFSGTTGVDIKNNLADASIVSREGASGAVNNNITNTTATLFVNPAAGDLHLKQTATAVIDKGVAVSVTDDFDGQARPQGAASDIGADEFATSTTAPAAPSSLVLQ